MELAVLAVPILSILAGSVPGAWFAWRGHERSRGHPWLAGIVGVLAVVVVTVYTVGGGSEQLFSRVVMLPLSLIIAIAAVVVLVGVPMFAGYLFAYRLTAKSRPR